LSKMPLVEIIVPPSGPSNVPAFLAKLWKMVENPETDNFICWTEDGSSFRIRDPTTFAASLLPYYYKHSNMASFIRQLNMYGFHKVLALHSGNLKSEKEEIEFAHTFFIRGQEQWLEQIKRKSSSSSNKSQVPSSFVSCGVKKENVFITKLENPDKEDMVTDFMVEMGQMKERQEDLDNKLENMRSENEALWGEVLTLRQKHNQQQKIVNKLIQFLVALVQPRINKGIKRKFRHPSFPSHKLAIEEGIAVETPSPKEAKVQELSEEIEDCHLSDILPMDEAQDPINIKSKYTMVDPASVSPTLQHSTPEKQSHQTKPNLSPSKLMPKSDLEHDSEMMQRELDSLQDILTGQITLDTSFMTGIISGSDSGSSDMLPGMKLFADSLLTPTNEFYNKSQDYDQNTSMDHKFLTYDTDINMKSSILALAAQSSGINLEEELLTTPSKEEFLTTPSKESLGIGIDVDF